MNEAYLLPNDDSEADRLDMVHEMVLTMMHRKLFLAPIKSPQRAIDLGTGTGIWTIDFGMIYDYPRAGFSCPVKYICILTTHLKANSEINK